MLIFFDPIVADLEQANPNGLELFYSEILRASEFGFHKVVLGRGAVAWALENLSVSARHKALLTGKKQSYTQDGSLKSNAPCSLEVFVGEQAPECLNAGQFRIGHLTALKGNYLAPSLLIAENAENDGDFFEVVFQATCRNQAVTNFHFERRNGGGSTIVGEFSSSISGKRISVCLVDSDRPTPVSGPSSTFKTLEKIRDASCFVGALFETRCLEVENHLPYEILRDFNLAPNFKEWEKLEKLFTAQGACGLTDCFWLRFDVKKGFKPAMLLKAGLSPEAHDWLHSKFNPDSVPPASTSIQGFGDEVLRQFLNSGPAILAFREHVKSDRWKENFRDFVTKVYWYFVCDVRKSVM